MVMTGQQTPEGLKANKLKSSPARLFPSIQENERVRSRSHPATQMLVSEKERDDLLSTSLVAAPRNTLR